MTRKTFLKITLYFTTVITLTILALLFWDYFHDGVPGHNLLKRKDLPKISNWWGAISLPLATYISLKRIEKRINFNADFSNQSFIKQHLLPFLIALLYGIFIVIFSSTGNSQISYSMFLILFAVALFIPIYKSEYFLGFILGLSYTFGGALPVIIGLVLITVFYLLFKFIRPIFIFLGTKIGLVKTKT
jgi:hypothetical protein